MHVNSDPFAGLNQTDGKKRSAWEIEQCLASPPFVKDIASAVSGQNGHWYINTSLHQSNTYGELLFWEWLAKHGMDYDRLGCSNSKIGFFNQYSPGNTWEYESYSSFMNSNSNKHGLTWGSPPWMGKHMFIHGNYGSAPVEEFWTVPVLREHLAEGFTSGNHNQEFNSNNRLKRIGWALWRVTREFEGKVGFFDGSFVCSVETDAVVLAPYCEMLGILRTIPEPEQTGGWFEKP